MKNHLQQTKQSVPVPHAVKQCKHTAGRVTPSKLTLSGLIPLLLRTVAAGWGDGNEFVRTWLVSGV